MHPARAIQKTQPRRHITKSPPSVNSWPIASSRAPKSISRTRRGRSVTALRTSSGGFAIRRGFASSARNPKNTAAAPHHKKPPLSQFLADCFISSTKIHLQDSTRAIGDSASNVVRRFCYKEGICIQRTRSKKHSDLHPARAIQKTHLQHHNIMSQIEVEDTPR